MALISFDVYNDFKHAEFWSSKCKDSPYAVRESARCTFLDTSTSNVATGIVSTVLLKVAWSIGQAPTLHRRPGWQLDGWLGEVVDGRCKNAKTYGKSAQDDVYIGWSWDYILEIYIYMILHISEVWLIANSSSHSTGAIDSKTSKVLHVLHRVARSSAPMGRQPTTIQWRWNPTTPWRISPRWTTVGQDSRQQLQLLYDCMIIQKLQMFKNVQKRPKKHVIMRTCDMFFWLSGSCDIWIWKPLVMNVSPCWREMSIWGV